MVSLLCLSTSTHVDALSLVSKFTISAPFIVRFAGITTIETWSITIRGTIPQKKRQSGVCAGAAVSNVFIRPVNVLVLSCVQLVLVTAVVVTPHPWAGQQVPASPLSSFTGTQRPSGHLKVALKPISVLCW